MEYKRSTIIDNKMKKQTKKRSPYLDIIKAILIILVIMIMK